jgi:small-conductance mechanosensitive channel
MDNPIFIIGAILCFIVVIILALGLGSFAKGGQTAKNHSNRLMRYRLIAQAVVIIFVVAAAYFGLGAK